MFDFLYLRSIICLAISFFICLFVSTSCIAQSLLPKENIPNKNMLNIRYNFAEIGNGREIVLSDADPMTTLYVPFNHAQLLQAKMHILLSYAPIFRADSISALSVIVNNVLVSSIALNSKNTTAVQWNVPIPTSLLSSNMIIKFVLYRGHQKVANIANWVKISLKSHIALTYQKQVLSFELAQLPYPFINNASVMVNSPLLVLPENLTTNELAPAFKIASMLGARSGGERVEMQISNQADFNTVKNSNFNIILLGKTADIPLVKELIPQLPLNLNQEGYFTDKSGQRVLQDTGIIMLSPSKWNPEHAILIVTGSTDEAVNKAAVALSNAIFSKFLHGQYALISQAYYHNLVRNKQELFWDNTTLRNLGYRDVSVSNEGQSYISYAINLPFDKTPEALQVNVRLSHSPLLSSNHSSVIFLINNYAETSLGLFPSNANNFTWKVVATPPELKPGKNILTFLFYMNTNPNAPPSFNKTWATIHANTTLEADFKKGLPQVKLNQFPIPFGANTVFLLPEKPSVLERNAALNLMHYLGKKLGQDALEIKVLSEKSALISSLGNSNIILLGLPENNQLLKNSLNYMPMNIQGTNLIFKNMFFDVVLENNKPMGILQKQKSSFNPNFAELVITGADDKSILSAVDLLINKKFQHKFNSNTLMVDTLTGEFYTNPKAVSSLSKIKIKFSFAQIRNIIIALIILIGLIVLFFIKQRIIKITHLKPGYRKV